MNNFVNVARKVNRNSLERTVVSRLAGKYPGLEQSISAHRFPVLPKIVLYSSLASSESFLRTYGWVHAASSPSTT
jgi:hypothetical protein